MNIRSILIDMVLFSVLTISAISRAPAAPSITPDKPTVKLDEIGIYSVGYQYRNKPAQAFADGWSGMFENQTGISCLPFGLQQGKGAFLLHCPWRNGTGITYQEFVFQIPRVKQAYLSGFTAMAEQNVDKSDGAIFRIYINGKKSFETYRKDAVWKPFKINLSSFAGQTVRIRFETDPGPNDDPSYDYSLWGDRELTLVGYKPAPLSQITPPPLLMSKVRSSDNGSVVPISGFDGSTTINLKADSAVFQYSGPDGKLVYTWRFPSKTSDPPFGFITLTGAQKGGKPFKLTVGATGSIQWIGTAISGKCAWQKGGDGSIECKRQFSVNGKDAAITLKGSIQGKSLVLDFSCDEGLLSEIGAGGWTNAMYQRQVAIPYYSGKVCYLPRENLFVNSFLDWTSSSATTHADNNAIYLPLTDGTYNLAHERIIYAAAWHLDEVVPNIPNPKSPYLKTVGDRIVLDIWGGRFTDIAENLRKLHDFGITNCIAIIHDWQRSGYDNALPMHIPANPALGGDEGMKTLVSTARELGYLIALHENYVDYYPNYDYYDENDIALDSNGNKQLAWYNEGIKIQSYAVKPNAILRLAATQSPEIHRRYGTNADYLDVHSSAPPFFHVDQRAGEQGAGMYLQTWKTHRQLWAFERETHGGPVLGEGNAHWYWSGLLDGVEAQFGLGWPASNGMKAPLMVDFDLLKIHPLQANHGMGYYERWWRNPSWGALPPMVVMDQYRMQEIAYGHNGFLSKNVWSSIPHAWLEHNLVAPVSSSYAEAVPLSIEYQINGKWVDSTRAAKAGEWNRLKVRYDNGLTVIANNSKDAMKEGRYTLPQYGWLAEGAGVTAYTANRDGVVADYAETADSVFANARASAVWSLQGIKRIHPLLEAFRQVSPRTFTFTYKWLSSEAISRDYVCFVHFCKSDESQSYERISFQQDHQLAVPTSTWKSGETVIDGPYTLTIPDGVTDGDYDWFIGLADVVDGSRLSIEGVDDGNQRIHLGVLHVSGNGSKITFTPESKSGTDKAKLYAANINADSSVVDFGTVRTNGSVMIKRDGADWVMQTLPRDVDFVIELSTAKFRKPSAIVCDGGKTISPSDAGDGWWRVVPNGSVSYRWSAD